MGMLVTVKRKDWPDLRLPYPSEEADRFMPRDGDQLSLTVPENVRVALEAKRKTGISVVAPGLPYQHHFALGYKVRREARVAIPPTLAQIIAEIYGGIAINRRWADIGTPAFLGSLIPTPGGSTSPSAPTPWTAGILPYPDFSDIRIVRQDGIVKVDWSPLIEAADQSSAEEIKKADHELQAGDVIELRVRADRPAGDWKGFSPKEEQFLAKALQGRVQFTGADATVSLEQINYKAPRYAETRAGWLPISPEVGSPGVKASDVLKHKGISGSLIDITRAGTTRERQSPSAVFLGDGDVVKISAGQPRQPVGTQPIPDPRPGSIPR